MSKREAVVYGRRASLMVAEHRAQDIKRVFYEEGAPNRDLKPLLQSCAQQKKPYRAVSVEELFKISGSTHHEGVVVVTRPLQRVEFEDYLKTYFFTKVTKKTSGQTQAESKKRPIWVAFDRVDNDHNHGAIARTLAWFGAEGLIWEAPRPQLSPSALRIAQGGAEQISLLAVPSLSQALEQLKKQGVLILGADQHAERSAFAQPEELSPKGVCWVMGSEQYGLSNGIKKRCDALMTIPGHGQLESLNVSVSAGLLIAQSYQWLN